MAADPDGAEKLADGAAVAWCAPGHHGSTWQLKLWCAPLLLYVCICLLATYPHA